MPSRVAFVVLAVALVFAGCGGDEGGGSSSSELVVGSPDHGLQHIHGLGVSGGNLLIATHTGLWMASEGQTKPRRIGASQQDIMGFSVAGGDRFIGSGHPSLDQRELPPNLGLIESRDGGRSWKSISLLGNADFHVLKASGRRVYGVNSADGGLMASSDGGHSWQRRTPPPGLFDLAVDPRSPQRIVASTEQGVFSSTDAGKGWRPLATDVAGLLAWPAADRLYLVGGDGAVRVSHDGGREWEPVGTIDGEPAAFVADGGTLYAALADATVKRSSDGGRSWVLRAAP